MSSNGYPSSLGNGEPPARPNPIDRMLSGGIGAAYNPYAPPNMHDMRQANMARARVHTLGPTFSDEEDGDDTEFIQSRMRALGLSDRDVYGNSIYNHVPYPASGYAPPSVPPAQRSLRPTAPEYRPPVLSGPHADPGYRKYGQVDPATNKSYCPYPELASYAQNQRQAQSTDAFRQMELQAKAQASARAQLEAMRFQAQMQQYMEDEERNAYMAGDERMQPHARKKTEEEDEQELLRKLQVVREARLKKQMDLEMRYRLAAGPPAPMSSASMSSRSMSSSSQTSSMGGSPIETKYSPVIPSVPLLTAAAGGYINPRPHTAEALGSLAALMARRAQTSPAVTAAPAAPDTTANVVDLTPTSPIDIDRYSEERREARAGLAALGHGRPRPSTESLTPPEATVPASVPSTRTTSQPTPTTTSTRPSGSHSHALQMQRRSITQPLIRVVKPEHDTETSQTASAPVAQLTRQPSGPPDEKELGKKNFAVMKRRAAGVNLGVLGRRRMESAATESSKSTEGQALEEEEEEEL